MLDVCFRDMSNEEKDHQRATVLATNGRGSGGGVSRNIDLNLDNTAIRANVTDVVYQNNESCRTILSTLTSDDDHGGTKKRKSKDPNGGRFIHGNNQPQDDPSNNLPSEDFPDNSPADTSNDNRPQSRSTVRSSTRNIPLVKPEGRFGGFRYQCGLFINHPFSENFILFIIFCNTILLIYSTFVTDDKDIMSVLNIVDTFFLGIFTFESTLQIIYWDIKLLKDKWLTFDLILVIASWAFSTFTVLRCLRILKIASKVESLRRLLNALMDVIPNISAIFTLLLLVFYIFAVMFTILFRDLELEINYFGDLHHTIFSLFQFMTMDWQHAARECQKHIPWAPVLFIIFVIASGFIVFNLIVAVLCDALGLLDKLNSDENTEQITIEKERVDAINNLMDQVHQIKAKQDAIRQKLGEIKTEYDHWG